MEINVEVVEREAVNVNINQYNGLSNDPTQVSLTNGGLVAINAGMAVGKNSVSGEIVLADSDSIECIGLAKEVIAVGLSGLVKLSEVLELNDWTDSIGSANLVPNQKYFLGLNGLLTTSPNIYAYSQFIGKALTTKKLLIIIKQFIKR